MNRRSALVVLLAVLAALVGVALLGVSGSPIHRKTTLGLDLQGGLEVTLKAQPPKGQKLQKGDLDRSVTIIRQRIDKLGVSEPVVTKQGSDQIAIQLPGIKDPEAAAKLIGKTAQLEFFDLEADLVPPSIDITTRSPIAKTTLYSLLSGQQALVTPDSESWYLFDAKKQLRAGPLPTKQALLAAKVLEAHGGALPAGWKVFGVPAKTVVVNCGVPDGFCPGVNTAAVTRTYYYLMKYEPPESGTRPMPMKPGTNAASSAAIR